MLEKFTKKNKESPEASNPQGITASGNALYNAVAIALLIMLVPMLSGFAYLAWIREPSLERAQVDRASSAFALQQSVNVAQFNARLAERMRSAAGSALALSAIGENSPAELKAIQQAMLDFFPEVTSLHIIPIGDMGTADFNAGSDGLRNHIEVDLVRRTSTGENTLPESYQIDNQWLTSQAELIANPARPSARAVIITTIENQVLSDELKALDAAMGKSVLEQLYRRGDNTRTDAIASAGSGDATEFTRYADIPGSNWRIAFTPSAVLMSGLAIDSFAILGFAALFLVSALAAAAVITVFYRRTLANEVDKVIAAADRKSPLVLSVPELVNLAKQLRRATLRSLRSLRQSNGAPTQAAPRAANASDDELGSPMFQSDNMLADQEESLDLDITAGGDELSLEPATGQFPRHIFRAYDIRGDAELELTDHVVAAIGGAISSVALEAEQQAIIIGCDGRTSSPRIKTTLVRALMECGVDVIDIGIVPTPLLYFATRHLDCRSGVMVTGSHNPAGDNGLKIVMSQQTIAAGGIETIRDRALEGKFPKGQGRMIKEDITEAYINAVVDDVAIAVPLKIVIDAGNGVTGELAPTLFEELGCDIVPLHCEIDGTFPNHPPDTSNEDNLSQLLAAVQREGADFGVAFDGDGDRLAVITGSGKIVRSDVLMMIYAEDVVSRNPGADVIFDVKCSRNLPQLITRHGGRPVLWKTGHAFMKEKMQETQALLGGEFSGHIFFGERWYGFDDAMYAAGRLAEILSTSGATLDEVLEELPQSISTPEIIIPVPEADKFAIMDKIVYNADFSSGKTNTLDGIRVDFRNGWGLLRASNTTAALTARFEADTEADLETIKQEFRAQVALIQPDLELNI